MLHQIPCHLPSRCYLHTKRTLTAGQEIALVYPGYGVIVTSVELEWFIDEDHPIHTFRDHAYPPVMGYINGLWERHGSQQHFPTEGHA